jgi:excisionase family DNA binding protein
MTTVMTLDQVAEFLHVHPSTVYRLLKDRRIPAFKMGSDWRFRQESIEQWIKTLEAELPSETSEPPTPPQPSAATPPRPSGRGRIRADKAR